jgi:hypothetical protein
MCEIKKATEIGSCFLYFGLKKKNNLFFSKKSEGLEKKTLLLIKLNMYKEK